MTTLVIPNRRYPPPADVRDSAAAILDQLADLTVAVVERAAGGDCPAGLRPPLPGS